MDKCLPFGASISCAIFQAFSDALKHIMNVWTKADDNLTNYLDDFLFISLSKTGCDHLVSTFLELCRRIGCPVAEEKTEWRMTRIIFLGILLDGTSHTLSIPNDKRRKAVNLLKNMEAKKIHHDQGLAEAYGNIELSL